MTPNTMRNIDFWVGVPICFALTLWSRFVSIFSGSSSTRETTPPKNILLIQLAEMGTMVVAYPAIRRLKELHPEATIHFLCFRQIRSSVEIIDVMDPANIITIDEGSPTTLVRDTLSFLWQARRRRIDTTINLETYVRYSTILSYLCGARQRVGFHRFNVEGVYTGDFLTHKVLYNAHIHAAHTFLDLVHALDAPATSVPRVKRSRDDDDLTVPRIETSDETRRALWKKLSEMSPEIDESKRLVVLNPNASKRFPMRRLPLEDYGRLAELLLEDPSVCVLVTGVAQEKADAEYICARIPSPRVLDLSGKTSFLELLDLFNIADVLISNDSGPAHFACMTDIHVVVFFGPELPDRYRPLTSRCDVVYSGYTCSPCVSPFNQRLTPCNDNQCLQNVPLESVARTVRSRLESRRQNVGV